MWRSNPRHLSPDPESNTLTIRPRPLPCSMMCMYILLHHWAQIVWGVWCHRSFRIIISTVIALPLSCFRMYTDTRTAFLPSCCIYPMSSQDRRTCSLELCGLHSIWCLHRKVGPVQFYLAFSITLTLINIHLIETRRKVGLDSLIANEPKLI